MTLIPETFDPLWPGTPHSYLDFLGDCSRGLDTRQLAELTIGLLPTEQAAYWREIGQTEENITEALGTARGWRTSLVETFSGLELADILTETFDTVTESVERGDLEGEGSQTIRYPSGIAAVDKRCGGFYGVTTIVSDTGLGKSMAAVGASVDAALAGIRVVYLNAEIPLEPFKWRLKARLAGAASGYSMEARAARFAENFEWWAVRSGLDLREITRAVLECVKPRDERILIVVDSVNTVTEMVDDDYFGTLKRIGLWAMESRRVSEGRIGWLLLSETNQRGEVKGGKLGFLSDMVLHIAKGDHPDYCRLIVQKGREGGGGDLGVFLREWKTGRFIGEGEQGGDFTPRAVNGANGGVHDDDEPVY